MIRRRDAATRASLLAFVLAIAVRATIARAEDTARDPAAAEALFSEAKALMAENELALACPKLEQSMRLDPGTGTLLNLALCHEGLGKVATAWAEFREVETRASRVGRGDRADLARDHQKALEKRLSHLTIVVPAATKVAGLEVRIDGVARNEITWGEELPIDPGVHRLEARAPGKQTSSIDVTIGAVHDEQHVTVSPLLDALAVPAPPPPPNVVTVLPPENTAKRTAGFIVGGIGVTALGIGSIFGILAMSTEKGARAQCAPVCTGEAERASMDAVRFANVSNVGFLAGVLALGTGTFLVLTNPRARVQVAPQAAPRSAGLSVRGAW